jgi:RHS repeat-associated protein
VVKAGDVELAYDKSGNMTDDGSRTFEYDAFNRIRTVKRKADSLTIGEYTYDALGRRIRKTISNGGLGGGIANGTTDYLYAGNQCIEERNASNAPTRQFVWGLYIDELIQLREDVSGAPADFYPLQDLLYRTTALTDSSGDIVEAYDTDAYGRTLAFSSPGPDGHWFTDDDVTTSQPRCEYIYTGRQYDPESQLYYYRARYYNPTLGRFMQRDPMEYVDGMGLYEYAIARSTIMTDPTGFSGDFYTHQRYARAFVQGYRRSWRKGEPSAESDFSQAYEGAVEAMRENRDNFGSELGDLSHLAVSKEDCCGTDQDKLNAELDCSRKVAEIVPDFFDALAENGLGALAGLAGIVGGALLTTKTLGLGFKLGGGALMGAGTMQTGKSIYEFSKAMEAGHQAEQWAAENCSCERLLERLSRYA